MGKRGAAHHGFRGSPDSFLLLFFVHTPTDQRPVSARAIIVRQRGLLEDGTQRPEFMQLHAVTRPCIVLAAGIAGMLANGVTRTRIVIQL